MKNPFKKVQKQKKNLDFLPDKKIFKRENMVFKKIIKLLKLLII
jgi:hypothetical protein